MMKTTLALLGVSQVAGLADFAKLQQVTFGVDFAYWAQQHSKSYETHEELVERFEIWKDNREFVNNHNEKHARGEKSFTCALNSLGDMSNKEYQQKMLGRKSTGRRQGVKQVAWAPKDDTPDSFDWRETDGIVNSIKDQAQCGSCWSFSAVAAMEGAYNKANNASISSTCDAKCGNKACCSFSEQELVDCTKGGSYGCDTGGIMSDGVMEIVDDQGGKANTESQYPYTSGGGSSPGVCHAKASSAVATGITGFGQVKSGDEDDCKNAVYTHSILSIGIDASQMSFQFYNKGVYDEPRCKNGDYDLDHGVSIVGYGSNPAPAPTPPTPAPAPTKGPANCWNDDDESSCLADGCSWCESIDFCFSTPCVSEETTAAALKAKLSFQAQAAPAEADGIDYWWVRNSWGHGWGDSGYIKMSRNKNNQCGVATDSIWAIIGK